MINLIRNNIVLWKFRISYLSGFVTTFAGILIISDSIQSKLQTIGIGIKYIYIFPVILGIIILVSYTLDKLGFIDTEIDYSNTKNKMLKEIHKKG